MPSLAHQNYISRDVCLRTYSCSPNSGPGGGPRCNAVPAGKARPPSDANARCLPWASLCTRPGHPRRVSTPDHGKEVDEDWGVAAVGCVDASCIKGTIEDWLMVLLCCSDRERDRDRGYRRSPSPYRRRSPAYRRRSPSPYARRRSPSPYARRRSPSPYTRRRSISP